MNVRLYVPPVLAAGVPLSFPVPSPLSTKVSPVGKAPTSLKLGLGDPLVVTVNVPEAPTVNRALAELVMVGPWTLEPLRPTT